jgi:homoserine kinase
MAEVSVVVPASSANLGPGFDAVGMALGLYDEVEVSTIGGGELLVEVVGEGAGSVPRDERHLVVRAVRAGFDVMGVASRGLAVRCRNVIPHGRGLGSSSAAAVAGLVAGTTLAGADVLSHDGRAGSDADVLDTVLQLAARFDGHPDNAAASLLGGLVVTWTDGDGVRAARAEPHPDLAPVLLVPATTSATEYTRSLLPATVPHADAAFNVGRAALLIHALTARLELLLEATDDRLHQPYRRSAYPPTAALVDALRKAGVPAAVSGAGPSVLALPRSGVLPEGVDTTGFAVRPLPVDLRGARVRRG